MASRHGLMPIAGWAIALGAFALALSGCKGSAQPAAPPPPEVTVIEAKPSMVTVYNEYVAQTQSSPRNSPRGCRVC